MCMRVLCIASAFLLCCAASAQTTVHLQNPSFEGLAKHSALPGNWQDCGFPGETPPDTHPVGAYGVQKKPFHGGTYLGMVARDNNTWERVSQRLQRPLQPWQGYTMRLYTCQSRRFKSISRTTNKKVDYTAPVLLRIYGGQRPCVEHDLLATVGPVNWRDWRAQDVYMYAKEKYTYISIEAYYADGTEKTNGHVMVDALGPIIPVSTEDSLSLAKTNIGYSPYKAPRRPGKARPLAHGYLTSPYGKLYRSLDTLSYQLPDDKDGLNEFLRLAIKELDWAQWDASLTDGVSGRSYQAEPHLWLMGLAVMRLPGYTLEVAVGGPEKVQGFEKNIRKDIVETALDKAGLDKSWYKVKKTNRLPRGEGWLWDEANAVGARAVLEPSKYPATKIEEQAAQLRQNKRDRNRVGQLEGLVIINGKTHAFQLESVDRLGLFLADYGSRVRLLKEACSFTDDYGDTFRADPNLWIMGVALQACPEYKAEVVVWGEDVENRIAYITEAFYQAGLDENTDYSIRPAKGKDRKSKWLWSMDTRHGFTLKINPVE